MPAPVCHVGLLYHKPTTMAVADFLDRAAPVPGGAA